MNIKPVVIASGMEINQMGTESIRQCLRVLRQLKQMDCSVAFKFIDPLMNPWGAGVRFFCGDGPQSMQSYAGEKLDFLTDMTSYRSGCGPIEALTSANRRIMCGDVDAVIIFGHEPLRTLSKHENGREEIATAMNIYKGLPIFSLYHALAHKLIRHLSITEADFKDIAFLLFENYCSTYEKINNTSLIMDVEKLNYLEDANLFRLVDCANPFAMDFTGGIILAHPKIAEKLNMDIKNGVQLLSSAYQHIPDGPEYLQDICAYRHLKAVIREATLDATIHDFRSSFVNGTLALEIYTCFPPPVIGFLLASGLVRTTDEIPALLKKHDITMTGGMNLAGAPWNCPALFATCTAVDHLYGNDAVTHACIHGNGGIGGYQGIAILGKHP